MTVVAETGLSISIPPNASTDVIRPAGMRLAADAPSICQNAVIRRPVTARFTTP